MTNEELNAIIAKAEAGDVAAMNQLGQIYGQDEYKDLNKAFYWINKSAETGDMLGMSNLGGWCYMWGNGTEKNIPEAIKWLTKAAEEFGNVWSMNRLTEIYGTFEGHINNEQAAKWFLALIQKDCDPKSDVYENTGYNKDLYEKIKSSIRNANSEAEISTKLSKIHNDSSFGNSLLDSSMLFSSDTSRTYIEQAEDAIKCNIEYKEALHRQAMEEAARKRAEEERVRREEEARRKAEEDCRRAEEERVRREEEARRKAEEDCRRAEEERVRKAEEAKRRAEERARKKLAKERADRMRELRARKMAEAEEEWQNVRVKEIELSLQTYCIENDHSISIKGSRFDLPSFIDANEMKRFLEFKGGEKYIVRLNGAEYSIKLYGPSRIEIKKQHLDESLQKQAEDKVLLDSKKKQIESDSSYSSVFKDEVGSFTIPEGTTRIGNHAFAKCAKLREVSIPESVVCVGERAFEGCERLETIQLPEGVTKIGARAFYCCKELKSILLGNSLTKIEYGTFEHCVSLKSIVLPNTVTTIEDSAFMNCCDLKSITLSPDISYIGKRVFEGCRSLEEIIVPRGKREEYLSRLKHNYLSDNIRIVEKNYTYRKQTNRDAFHKSSSPKKQGGSFLSRLWNLLTDD